MTAKLVGVSVITTLILLAVGVIVLFFLMLGMNGVSGPKSTPVFAGYLLLAAFTLLVCAVASGWGAGRVAGASGWPMWVVGPLAVVLFSVAGGALLFFGGVIIMAIFIA